MHGRAAEATESTRVLRSEGPAVLLSLVIVTCGAIYGIKYAIGIGNLWTKGSGLPLVVFDYRLPMWQSVPLALARTWLCCAEDFAAGLAILLIGSFVLKLFSVRTFAQRYPAMIRAGRYAFWTIAYAGALAAVGLMIANMFLFFEVDRFLDKKKLQMAGSIFAMEKSTQDQVTLPRTLVLAFLPVGLIAFQLLVVRHFPRTLQRAAYYLCRPSVVSAGLVTFLGLTWCVQTPGQIFDQPSYGSYTRNPHVYLATSYLPDRVRLLLGDWDIEHITIERGEVPDFLPGYPGLGDLQLKTRPRNIIFIVAESCGSRWMHAYGAPWQNTPNLEWIIDKEHKGVLFEDSYSISDHSIASAIGLFGSMNNNDCENCTVYAARNWPGPNRDFPVPAASTWLQKKGYRTYFMGAGGRSVWEGYKNFGRAFLPYGFDIAKDGHRHWGKETPDWGFKQDDHNDESLFADAYHCLDDAGKTDQPFFLMMWNYDTHWKYSDGEGPADWDESRFPAMVQGDPERLAQFRRYLSAIWRFDRLLGKLYSDLEDRGIADDTLLVIVGDHGQAFGQHGVWSHGYKLFEEEVRVPCIFINKNLGDYAVGHGCGPRNHVLCSQLDIWPTIMDICGLDCNKIWQGRSLFSTSVDPGKRHVYLWVGGVAAIREGDFKYIWDKEDFELYLFDVRNDPTEQNNLLRQQPVEFKSIKDRLHEQLHKWMSWQAEWNEDLLRNGSRD